jgi:hypothetical protein
MTNEAMPEQPKSKREELIEALELSYVALALNHNNREIAEMLVDRVIAIGWQWHPPKLEEYPDPTPEQEIEFLDRIVSGLPARPVGFKPEQWPDDVRLYDVNSLYPKEYTLRDLSPSSDKFLSDWYPLPEFDNYEIDSEGDVRNRHTKRVLDVVESNGIRYVEVDDDEGCPHILSVEHQLKVVFGI